MTVIINGTTGITTPGLTNDGSQTITGGTANGVAYLNGSKVLTTGSALQFDGSNLGLGITPSAWWFGGVLELSNGNVLSFAGPQGFITTNTYSNGGWKYKTTGLAAYYNQNAGQHQWFTAPSGTAGNAISFTQAMTLDASGQLALGTTTASTTLGKNITINGSAAGTNTGIVFSNAGTENGLVYSNSTQFAVGSATAIPAVFTTNNTERMRIDSSGNLLVGTTSTATNFGTKVTLSGDSGTTKWATGPATGAGATQFIISASASAGVYLSTTSASSWSSISDERHKDIFEPITNAVEKVGTLRAVIGKYKLDETNSRKSFLIAQDVLAVLPEAVDTSNPDRLGLQYTDVIPLLVAAIKELKAELDAVKAKVGV